MKLILLVVLLTQLEIIQSQKFRQENFPFPPQFQTPNAGLFSSESSLYLPPESHTQIPYFPFNKVNGLQYPLLPPTGTKAPTIYPPHFPFMISTTLVPHFEDDDDDDDRSRIRFSSTPQPASQGHNQTDKRTGPNLKEYRELRPVPKMMFPPPIQNRNDIKISFQPQATPPTTPASNNHQQQSNITPAPAARRMIISTETQKSDHGFDQFKAGSFQGPQFLPAGGGIYLSSTTEPAIPILRLSNEMDLDGSFSYEALGADQTHYVQHSRMENLGPDKQEQVVEGSYSYVGDNGQTYTVHYIADSNGFRASGDHLPVAPPVPEIIQRAVQYNIAEEAKKPPHLRDNGSWQPDTNNEISDSKQNQQFAPPPIRNLFTGRTPEAFSYSYSQGPNTENYNNNNLVAAASNHSPTKTVDYTTEQPRPKPNNGPISPQITFLASQGAHVPSVNTVQNTISRMFTTEKSTMPQLVNYEAAPKEADQDPNKGMWRWQYGMNANNLNQNPNKDSISRSFGEGDDVMINFGDMTPDQYTKMIHSQFEYIPENEGVINKQLTKNLQHNENQYNHNNEQAQNEKYAQNYEVKHENTQISDNYYQNQKTSEQIQNNKYGQFHEIKLEQTPYINDYQRSNEETQHNNNYQNIKNPEDDNSVLVEQIQQNPSTITPSTQSDEWYKQPQNVYEELHTQSTMKPLPENRKLISDTQKVQTHKDFVIPSHTITKSYNFDEETFYEPRKIKALNADTSIKPTTNHVNDVQNIFQKGNDDPHKPWPKVEIETQEQTTPEPYISTVGNLKFIDFIYQESSSDFKPIVTSTTTETPRFTETTTESIFENILENNIFLKNLFSAEKPETKSLKATERKTDNEINEEPKKLIQAEPKTDKIPKFIQYQSKPINEVKLHKKKPMDISDILNYVTLKNHFESSKTKPNNRPVNDFDHRNIQFIPIEHEREENVSNVNPKPNFRPSQEQHEELRGKIKNYKVLQRNSNANKYDNNSLKRELSPPPLKYPNLPPLGRAGPSMKSYLPPIFV